MLLLLAGSELKPNRPSGHGKEKKKKKFSAFSNFFFLGPDGNRFRLADVGGVEPLRKLIRQKLVPGRGLEVCCAAMVQRLLPRANVHESCTLVGPSTRGQTGVGAPRTGYPTVYPPRGQHGQERSCCQEYRIFFLGNFFSNLQQEHTRLCDSISRQRNRVRQF